MLLVLEVVRVVVRPDTPVIREPILGHEPPVRPHVVGPSVLRRAPVRTVAKTPQPVGLVALDEEGLGEGPVEGAYVGALGHPEVALKMTPRHLSTAPGRGGVRVREKRSEVLKKRVCTSALSAILWFNGAKDES